MTPEETERLLSAYLDGELTQQQAQRVRLMIEEDEGVRETYESYRKLKEATMRLDAKGPATAQWDEVWEQVRVRTTRQAGWGLLIGGVVLLYGYLLVELMRDPSVEAVIKIAIAALVTGLGLLLYLVVRERVIAARSDRYKEVER